MRRGGVARYNRRQTVQPSVALVIAMIAPAARVVPMIVEGTTTTRKAAKAIKQQRAKVKMATKWMAWACQGQGARRERRSQMAAPRRCQLIQWKG